MCVESAVSVVVLLISLCLAFGWVLKRTKTSRPEIMSVAVVNDIQRG